MTPRLPEKSRMRDLYEQVAPILAIVCLLSAFGAVGWSWENQRANHEQDHAAAVTAQQNAVVNCENANESRQASANLWNFVINLSMASNPTMSDQQRAFIAEFRTYVAKVYQPHDCSDLSKKYPLPSPPAVPAVS